MIIYTYSISVYLCNIQTILICMKYYLYTKNLSYTVYLFMGFMGNTLVRISKDMCMLLSYISL